MLIIRTHAQCCFLLLFFCFCFFACFFVSSSLKIKKNKKKGPESRADHARAVTSNKTVLQSFISVADPGGFESFH